MRTIVAAALLLAAAAVPAAEKASSIKDSQLGLSKVSVFDLPPRPVFAAESGAPGEKPLAQRVSSEVPPVIPHAVDDFLPITRDANRCIECHELPGPKVKGEPTPLPRSHYVDWRHDQGKKLEKHAGARWECTACHVTRSDAPPLVGNRFKP